MTITEYRLTIEQELLGEEKPIIKTIVYRGNENILIYSNNFTIFDEKTCIKFPRHILEAFIRMIEV